MSRIAGINVSDHKHIGIALTAIYGIGRTSAFKICNACDINSTTLVKELTDVQLDLLRLNIKNFVIEGDLRRKVAMDIKRLIDINAYRGKRHLRNLPVRGQRTKTNARTSKKRSRR